MPTPSASTLPVGHLGANRIGRYIKKPIPVEAYQWFKNGDHPEDYADPRNGLVDGKMTTFSGQHAREHKWEGAVVRYFRRPEVDGGSGCSRCGKFMDLHGWIDTLEGGHIVCPGDWIITGVKGERYPVKPDIFKETYQPAGAPTDPMTAQKEILDEALRVQVGLVEAIQRDAEGQDLAARLSAALSRPAPGHLSIQHSPDGVVFIQASDTSVWAIEPDPTWGIKIDTLGASLIPLNIPVLDRPDVIAKQRAYLKIEEEPTKPIPLYLTCPKCSQQHIDEGEWANKPHHTHACQHCGLTWRPAVAATVGVRFLPGFKNGVKS